MAMRIASVLPSRKQLLRFAFTPQLGGNFRSLSRVFLALVQTLAHALMTAGLIERSHPVFLGNMGGLEALGRVMVDAAANLKWNRKSLPQVIIYFAVALLLAMMVAMVVTLFAQVFIAVAFAADPAAAPGGALYAANDKARDWLLCILPTDDATPCVSIDPSSAAANNMFAQGVVGGAQLEQLARAIASMLAYYSTGCMVLAGIIVTYEVTAIVVETAKEGVLFGKRHNELWAPVRLVFAIAILTPLPNGYNSGQIAVVKFATWGSGFASNVWEKFVTASNQQGAAFAFAARAQSPEWRANVVEAIYDVFVAESAREATWVGYYPTTQTPCMHPSGASETVAGQDVVRLTEADIGCGLWTGQSAGENNALRDITMPGNDTQNANGSAQLGFPGSGERDRAPGVSSRAPTLGRVVLTITVPTMPVINLPADYKVPFENLAKANIKAQQEIIRDLVQGNGDYAEIRRTAFGAAKAAITPGGFDYNAFMAAAGSGDKFWKAVEKMETDWKTKMQDPINTFIEATRGDLFARQSTQWGWVGAGAWLLQISQRMQALNAVFNVQPAFRLENNYGAMAIQAAPTVTAGTSLQEAPVNRAVSTMGAWLRDAVASRSFTGQTTGMGASLGRQVNALNIGQQNGGSGTLEQTMSSFNVFAPLFNYLSNTGDPLNGLIQFGFAVMAASGAVLLATLGLPGTAGDILSILFIPIFSAGVMMAILFPLLPTLRFAFGMMSWILSILEAVFAVPIVALAHLRTDGAGLMGPMAQAAYLLLLQIFVRPALMILGLIGGLLVFNVTVDVVAKLFLFALQGFTGGGVQYYLIGIASVFVFASTVLIIANMCFKMVDMVPDQILRWIGSGGMGSVGDVGFAQGTLATAVGVTTGAVGTTRAANKEALAKAADKQKITDERSRESFAEHYSLTKGHPTSGMPKSPKDWADAKEAWRVVHDEMKNRKLDPFNDGEVAKFVSKAGGQAGGASSGDPNVMQGHVDDMTAPGMKPLGNVTKQEGQSTAPGPSTSGVGQPMPEEQMTPEEKTAVEASRKERQDILDKLTGKGGDENKDPPHPDPKGKG